METEEHIKGRPMADFRGYTVAEGEGDRDAARRVFEEHVWSKQSESAALSCQKGANEK